MFTVNAENCVLEATTCVLGHLETKSFIISHLVAPRSIMSSTHLLVVFAVVLIALKLPISMKFAVSWLNFTMDSYVFTLFLTAMVVSHVWLPINSQSPSDMYRLLPVFLVIMPIKSASTMKRFMIALTIAPVEFSATGLKFSYKIKCLKLLKRHEPILYNSRVTRRELVIPFRDA